MDYIAIFVVQCVTQSIRKGGPKDLKLESFMEALYSEMTQMPYHALVGTLKQSVSDVQQLFSSGILEFF